jgi:hypothetical protein
MHIIGFRERLRRVALSISAWRSKNRMIVLRECPLPIEVCDEKPRPCSFRLERKQIARTTEIEIHKAQVLKMILKSGRRLPPFGRRRLHWTRTDSQSRCRRSAVHASERMPSLQAFAQELVMFEPSYFNDLALNERIGSNGIFQKRSYIRL